jgi:hypothetical protein
MVRALVAFVIVVGGCTTDAPEDSPPQQPAPVAQPERVAQQPARGVQPDRNTAIEACRKACWDDIPVDGCKAQRDACFKRAAKRDKVAAKSGGELAADMATDKLAVDKLHCREMSRTCREIRHDCLAACEAPAVTK